MYIFILVIHIIVSMILVAVILLQAGRGGGLAETFGGGGSSQMTIFGQKATTFLTKATTVSAVLFLCTSLSLAFLSSKRQKSLMEAVKIAPVPSEVATAEKDTAAEKETAVTEWPAPAEEVPEKDDLSSK